jgi:uncharacterized protein with HEPN domain
MNLQPIRFEDEAHIRHEFALETTGKNRSFYTLIAKFIGAYGYGSGGHADACYMLGVTKTAVDIWGPAALILDLSELRYEWGDEMDWLLPPAVHIPAAVVVGPHSATAIATLMWGVDTTRHATEAEFVFDNLEAAWRYVREQKETGQSPTRRKVAPDRVLAAVEKLAGDAVQFTSGHSPETFRADKLTHYAVVQTVAMLGEAAGDLPASLRKRVPEVDWSELVRLGYHLRDHYYAVDLDQVWATVIGVFPALLPAVGRLLTELSERPALQETP